MSARRRLGPVDLLFLALETRESMMHVGSLMQFVPPADARPTFLYDLFEEIRRTSRAAPPWNLKLRFPELMTNPLQAWVEDPNFDVEYHVRRSALPSPGGERELGILVSRLHSYSIDFHRPPWEAHFIEGLPDGRFALYVKIHHSLIDGYSGMKLLARSFSTDPGERDTPPFFQRSDPTETSRRIDRRDPGLDALIERAKQEVASTRTAGRALAKVMRAARSHDRDLVAPLEAPRSMINGPISRNRRFATQQFRTERLHDVACRLGGTLNDAILAVSSGALRRILLEHGALPSEPMTAMIPVNLRPKDDPGGGNSVGAVLGSLATDIADPIERFHAIVASTRRAKDQLKGMTKAGVIQYSAMILAPMLLSQPPGAAGRVPLAFNLVISNIPGPSDTLYFRGYRLDAYYPLSIPVHGYSLNITAVTYGDTLNFGFTGDRDALPHLQRLAVYARDALDELERHASNPTGPFDSPGARR